MSSVITIGFSGRTRACIRTEFTAPIADNERRETLVHVALLTARSFAALTRENQLTLSGTLKEWIEDQFIACPSHLIPGDPMSCLPRFASTFVAPAREYALASKGCNHNGRGIEFFLPMATVSFLRHVAITYHDPEELLKPALALCAAVVIQPLSMETYFQAAAASLPKVGPVVDKTAAEEAVVETRPISAPPVRPTALPPPAPAPAVPARPRRSRRRRTLLISACLAALLIMAGVQYLSNYEPERLAGNVPEQPAAVEPAPSTADQAPELLAPLPEPLRETMPSTELPSIAPSVSEKPTPKLASRKILAYQQDARAIVEDAAAQVEVMVASIEGKVLTDYDLNEVLAYGRQEVRKDLQRFVRLAPPASYEERHREIRNALLELDTLANDITVAQDRSPLEGSWKQRLVKIQGSLGAILRALDNL
jgi:hypothetical protein